MVSQPDDQRQVKTNDYNPILNNLIKHTINYSNQIISMPAFGKCEYRGDSRARRIRARTARNRVKIPAREVP